MKVNIKTPIGLTCIFILSACSSPKPGTPEFVRTQEHEQQKMTVKGIESSISKTPSWFLSPPQDTNAIYTAGEGTSPDMQMAMDMAVMSAKRALATQLGSRVSVKMKDYAGQTGAGIDTDVIREIERTTKSVATDINLAGFSHEKSEIISEGKNFKTFALIRYPINEVNKIMFYQVKKNKVLDTKLKSSKAFQDLEEEIEAARVK